jgi:hypothetical protein
MNFVKGVGGGGGGVEAAARVEGVRKRRATLEEETEPIERPQAARRRWEAVTNLLLALRRRRGDVSLALVVDCERSARIAPPQRLREVARGSAGGDLLVRSHREWSGEVCITSPGAGWGRQRWMEHRQPSARRRRRVGGNQPSHANSRLWGDPRASDVTHWSSSQSVLNKPSPGQGRRAPRRRRERRAPSSGGVSRACGGEGRIRIVNVL